VRNADFLDSSYKIPGGGWLSSAEDMAHFEVAILSDNLIRRATRDLAWTPLKPSDGSEDNYGLGFGSSTEDGIRFIGHSGGQQGTSTDFLLAPDRLAGVVVLANMEGVPASGLAKEIMKIVLAKPSDEKKK
jgi:CubicO group peptidase (beta-lactamase class C family)